jgi:hypothetical protein
MDIQKNRKQLTGRLMSIPINNKVDHKWIKTPLKRYKQSKKQEIRPNYMLLIRDLLH